MQKPKATKDKRRITKPELKKTQNGHNVEKISSSKKILGKNKKFLFFCCFVKNIKKKCEIFISIFFSVFILF